MLVLQVDQQRCVVGGVGCSLISSIGESGSVQWQECDVVRTEYLHEVGASTKRRYQCFGYANLNWIMELLGNLWQVSRYR